jgi:type II secretory pathway component PulM
MEDHRLGDLLRELPREPARPGFTARLLQRLNRLEAPERRRSLPRLAMAGALATLAITAGVLVDARRDAREAIQARQALQEIRAEHGRLQREIQELSQPPVMYLGGNENVDLVLDLGQVGGTEGAKPAAYHDETF